MRVMLNKVSSVVLLCIFLATYLVIAINRNNRTANAIIYLHEQDTNLRKKNFLSGHQQLLHLTSSGNVIVIFYEDWCKFCQNMVPILQELSLKRSDILFVKVKRELYRDIFKSYNFSTVPALLFFKNGKLVHKEPFSLTYKKCLKLINAFYKK